MSDQICMFLQNSQGRILIVKLGCYCDNFQNCVTLSISFILLMFEKRIQLYSLNYESRSSRTRNIKIKNTKCKINGELTLKSHIIIFSMSLTEQTNLSL